MRFSVLRIIRVKRVHSSLVLSSLRKGWLEKIELVLKDERGLVIGSLFFIDNGNYRYTQ